MALARKFVQVRFQILPANSRREILYFRFIRPLLRKLLLRKERASANSADPEVLSVRPGPALSHGDVRELLIVKCDHLGDFLLALKAIEILRKGFPAARITLFCASWNSELALRSGLFDRVMCVDIFSEVSGKGAVPFDPRVLATYDLPVFDIAVDLRIAPESRFLLGYVSARLKAGFEDPLAELPLMDFSFRVPSSMGDDTPNYAGHTQVLLAAFASGIVSLFTPDQAPFNAFKPQIQDSTPRLERSGEGPLIGINTGSGGATRNWPLENFSSIIHDLAVRHGATIVLFGSKHQQADGVFVAERNAASSNKIVNFIGATTLVDLPQVIRQLDLYIGHDSGGTHLAAMLGIKTLCLHAGVSSLETRGPVGSHVVVLKCFNLSCSPCGLTNLAACSYGHRCMRAITPERVIVEIEKMLELRSGEQVPNCDDRPDRTAVRSEG